MRMPSPASPQRQDRILELDGLRGIACALVLLWHLVAGQIPREPGGWQVLRAALSQSWSGVDLFFVLSGYLITRNLARDSGRDGWARRFATARVFRLAPAYCLLLAGSVLVSAWVASAAQVPNAARYVVHNGNPLWIYLCFAQNWYPFLSGAASPLGSPFMSVTWSLGAEVEFYAGSVLLILACRPHLRPRALICAALAAVLFRILIVAAYPNPALSAFILPPARMDSFALGGLAALWLADPGIRQMAMRRMYLLKGCWAVLFLFVAALSAAEVPFAGRAAALGSYSCFALFYTLSLVLILLHSGSPALGWLRRGPLAGLGVISYGVYLFHVPLRPVVSAVFGIPDTYLTFTHGFQYLLLELGLLFLFCTAVWLCLEKPLIALGRRVARSA